MKDFSDFCDQKILDGEKMPINNVLDRDLVVLNFSERNSKYAKQADDKYIIIQIMLDGVNKVIFTASEVLREQLIKYRDMLPFSAQIIHNGKYFTFKGCKK